MVMRGWKFGLLENLWMLTIFMLKISLVSFLFSTFAPAKMRADALLPRQDVESLSVIKHGDEYPAW